MGTSTELKPSHYLAWYRGNSMADKDTADRVFIRSSGPGMWFDWPAERDKVERLEELLADAFERGRNNMRAEIKHILGLGPRP